MSSGGDVGAVGHADDSIVTAISSVDRTGVAIVSRTWPADGVKQAALIGVPPRIAQSS